MRKQDEDLFAFVLEHPSLETALNDTYQVNCSPWQLTIVREGQGHNLLSMLIDVNHPTTYV